MRVFVTTLLSSALLAAGCGDGVQPDQREMVYFAAIETDTLEPRTIADPGIDVPPAQVSSSEKIVNGFVENHERLLQDAEVGLRIEQIENLFLALGRFHEIMAIYRDDFEKRGVQSHVADRYAWGLIRLGHRKRARDIVNQLLVANPTDAKLHFLDGAAYLQEQPPRASDFPAIVRAWKRVLDLDPNYDGYEGITAELLAVEIQKFESRIPPSEREQVAPVPIEPVEPVEPMEPMEPAEPVEPVEPAEPAEPAEPVEPVAQPSEPSPEQEYRIAVARGQIALGLGKYADAENAFIVAKQMKPGDFAAEFGHLQAGWGTLAARNDVAAGMRKLAERKDLKPAQRLELGVFLWTKVGRKDLAKAQLEAAKSADPALAPRVEGLLETLSAAP